MVSILAGAKLHHLIRILTSDLRTQPLFRGIGDFFNRILSQGFEFDDQYSRANEQSRNVAVSPVIDAEEPYRINAGSWFFDRELHRSSGEDGGDPPAVFNVLDLVLIETMERLKKLTESITIVGRCKLYDGVINVSSSEDSSELNSRPKRCELIRGLCVEGKVGVALHLLRDLPGKCVYPDLFTCNILVNGLCKNGDLSTATWLLNLMPSFRLSPNTVTYNTLINGYCHWSTVDRALCLVSSMAERGVRPNRVTCNILVHALCNKGLLDDAKKLLSDILNDHKATNLITSTTLIDGYFRAGDMARALEHWNEMLTRRICTDQIAYNVIINGFSLGQDIKYAYRYISEMFEKVLIRGLCSKGKVWEAIDLFNKVEKSELAVDHVPFQIFVTIYSKMGKLLEALELYEEMTRKGLLGSYRMYKSLFKALKKNGYYFEASQVEGACASLQIETIRVINNKKISNILTYMYLTCHNHQSPITISGGDGIDDAFSDDGDSEDDDDPCGPGRGGEIGHTLVREGGRKAMIYRKR
ncbi:Pentatricopeptide repeat-containing protein [Ananas comosus]|uniref:Pentatricopeptide repeat-containing protein n=1 Tax=Ananas comosus TaxID=4615 RepID=A0A199UH03_ANACO|nr:Pentatricopeptide repeat-containing protein [Ananas comosus]